MIKMPDILKLVTNREFLLAVVGGTAVAIAIVKLMSRRRRSHGEMSDMVLVGEVSSLNCHPVKSLKGFSNDVAYCTFAGMRMLNALDRQFVVVGPNGDFLTQRQVPKMSAITTSCIGDELYLQAPGMRAIKIPLHPNRNDDAITQCRVWDSHMNAQDCGSEIGLWLSNFLGRPDLHLLVRMPGVTHRTCTEQNATNKDKVTFQDKAPFHLATDTSLEDFLQRVGSPANKEITMDNFRPNIVVKANVAAWDEDNWSSVHIGKYLRMRVMAPTDRCVLTTVDSKTQERRQDGEPLKTLKSFRIFPEVSKTSPLFGIMLGVESENTIRVGDPVYVRYKTN